jgi:hypothetical protein
MGVLPILFFVPFIWLRSKIGFTFAHAVEESSQVSGLVLRFVSLPSLAPIRKGSPRTTYCELLNRDAIRIICIALLRLQRHTMRRVQVGELRARNISLS